MRLFLAGFACLTLWQCGGASRPTDPAADAGSGLSLVRIENQLDTGTLGLIKRSIDRAVGRGDRSLVVELDTPGGSIALMHQIARQISSAPEDLLLIAWIHDSALSAGVLIALACDKMYMTPEAVIGAAMPVVPGLPGGMVELPEGGVREKYTSALRKQFRAMAEKGSRPGLIAEAMVDREIEVREIEIDGRRELVDGTGWDDARERGDPVMLIRTICPRGTLLTLSASEAVELGFADGLAADLEVLSEKIGEGGTPIVRVERRRSEELLALLDRLTPLLLVIAIALAYTEFKMPGFGLPGVLSIACFALVLTGRYLAGLADIPHILMVAVGLALIAVELFLIPGTLWAGLSGALLLLGGLILAGVGPGFSFNSALDRTLLFDSSFQLMLTALGALMLALVISRFLPKTPVLRGLVLDPARDGPSSAMRAEPVYAEAADARSAAARIGARGVAISALRPVGKVRLEGAGELEFEARASGPLIDRGSAVRVVELETGRLVVERDVQPSDG